MDGAAGYKPPAPPSDTVTVPRAELKAALETAKAAGEAGERAAGQRILEAQAKAHESEIDRLMAEVVHREKAAYAHGWHKAAWMFGFGGAGAGIALALIVVLIVLSAGTESTVRGAAAGSMIRAQEELERDQRAYEFGEQP